MPRASVLRANLRSSGKRLWAAGAAITVSVAFIVAGFMLVESFSQVVTEEAEAEAAGADLIIPTGPLSSWEETDEGEMLAGAHGDEPLAEAIRDLDAVDSAEAVRWNFLEYQTEEPNDWAGFEVQTLSSSRPLELSAGRLPAAEDELLVNATAAEDEGLRPGSTLTAVSDVSPQEEVGNPAQVREKELTVVGVTEDDGWPAGWLSPEAMAGLEDAGFGAGEPDHIRVRLGESTHGDVAAQEAVQEEIAALVTELIAAGSLPMLAEAGDGISPETVAHGILSVAGLQIATHQQIIDQWVQERTGDAQILQWVALGFGGIAVFVSALVIANTFQVIVASRLRTMALIRAVGGTAAQLRRATLAEGALLGLLGGVVGVLLGWGIAQGLIVVINMFNEDSVPAVLPGPAAIGIGLGLGVLMTAGSALLPALKAGRVSPMAALRPADVAAPEGGVSRLRLSVGALLAAAGLATVLYAALIEPREPDAYGAVNMEPLTGLPLPVIGVAGGVAGFLGVLVLAKAVIPPLVAGLGRAASIWRPVRVPAKLAGQNARQVPGRTTATSAALLVGVTLVVTMTVGAATAQRMLYSELAESYPVDGVVSGDHTAELSEHGEVSAALSAPAVEVEIGEDDATAQLVFLNRAEHSAVFHGEWPFAPADRSAGPQAYIGDQLEPYADPQDDGARTLGVEFPQGAEVPFTLAEGWSSLPATMIAVDAAQLRESPAWFGADGEGSITLVRLVEGLDSSEVMQLESQLEALGESSESGMVFEGGLTRSEYSQIIDMVLLIVLALLGASVFVAVIGVSNTLSLSVFERRREAALLRAVGMTRRAVGSMISIEAILLAGVALILGTGLGVLFGWAGISTLIAREDWAVVLSIPWPRMAAIWGVTLLAALAAAWLPARSLSKVQPARGLSAQ